MLAADSPYTIRKLTSYSRAAEMGIEALLGTQLYRDDDDRDFQEGWLGGLVTRRKRCAVIVAEYTAPNSVGPTIVGSAILNSEMRPKGPAARLTDFVVDKPHRGNGIGTALFETSRQEAQNHLGATALTFTTPSDWTDALDFYAKLGIYPKEDKQSFLVFL